MQSFWPDKDRVLGPLVKGLVVWLLICALIALFLLFTNPRTIGTLAFAMLAFTSPIFLLMALLVGLTFARSIQIGDAGVARAFAGHRVKQIAWSDVTAVYKIRYFDANQEKHQSEFVVMAKSKYIIIDNLIGPTPKIVEALNEYISKFRIPAFFVDLSVNGRAAQFAAAVLSQSNNGIPIQGEGSKVLSF